MLKLEANKYLPPRFSHAFENLCAYFKIPLDKESQVILDMSSTGTIKMNQSGERGMNVPSNCSILEVNEEEPKKKSNGFETK